MKFQKNMEYNKIFGKSGGHEEEWLQLVKTKVKAKW